MENEQTNETQLNNWLEQEKKNLDESRPDIEQLESLKFEENKITEFTVDFSKPFEKWKDPENQLIKKIIPVTQNGEKKNLWINVRNPLYAELVNRGMNGETQFKVIQTGTQKNTKYALVD